MADFNLPNEIWCKIFSYLPLAPKKNATATCKLWFRLIREDPKLSVYILISWNIMEIALETLQWNWSNWPALKTLELNKLELVEDSREAIRNVIEKLSLKDHGPLSFEGVLFDVNIWPIPTKGMSLLKYQLNTDEIFGLGEKLDSMEKWNEYESSMKALKRLKSMRYSADGPKFGKLPDHISATLAGVLYTVIREDPKLLKACPYFQVFRPLCDRLRVIQSRPGDHFVFGPERRAYIGAGPSNGAQFVGNRVNDEKWWNSVQYMELGSFLGESEMDW